MDNILTYKGYRAEIDFSYQNNCFTGKILGINDAVCFQGKTVTELKTAFHSALNEYLDKCKKEGQKPGKEYKGSFNVRVGQSLHEASVKASEDLGVSLNQFVTDAINEKLGRLNEPFYKITESEMPVLAEAPALANAYYAPNSIPQNKDFEIRPMEFPKGMSPYLEGSDSHVMFERNAMILYPYIQRGVLTNGRAAEILGVSKRSLMDYYSSKGIPYIHIAAEDLYEDIATINRMAGNDK